MPDLNGWIGRQTDYQLARLHDQLWKVIVIEWQLLMAKVWLSGSNWMAIQDSLEFSSIEFLNAQGAAGAIAEECSKIH